MQLMIYVVTIIAFVLSTSSAIFCLAICIRMLMSNLLDRLPSKSNRCFRFEFFVSELADERGFNPILADSEEIRNEDVTVDK